MARRVKITQAGWEDFTGEFGTTLFEDGISVDAVSQRTFDAIAANIAAVPVDDEGVEGEPAGVADRLVGGATIGAPVVEALSRQSDEEKKTEVEAPKVAAQNEAAPVTKIYTLAELEEIVDEGGIKKLREVAAPLGVKGRQIDELLREILEAQEKIAPAPAPANDFVEEGDEIPATEAQG